MNHVVVGTALTEVDGVGLDAVGEDGRVIDVVARVLNADERGVRLVTDRT